MHRDSSELTKQPSDTQEVLPLEASPAQWERGWRVRLPVRAEHIELEKQAVIYERVAVHRREIDQLDHIDATARREELRVKAEGDAGPAGMHLQRSRCE
jgi:uncharacterized protein (TIGR02271 family)